MLSYPARCASWVLIDEHTGFKVLDKSCFDSNGTAIPMKTRPFFLESEMQQGEKRDVSLFYNGKKYKAFITMLNTKSEKKPRTQMYWEIDFTELLSKTFISQYKKLTGIDNDVKTLPNAHLILKRKIGVSEYNVSFDTAKTRKITK